MEEKIEKNEAADRSILCYDWLSTRRSILFSWQIPNAWQVALAYEACLLIQMNLEKEGKKTENNINKWLSGRLMSSKLPCNLSYWFGLSGSDDLAWSGMLCCLCAEYSENSRDDFLYSKKFFNGRRGAVPSFEAINNHYVEPDGSVFWNFERSYKASISNSTFCLLCLYLYKALKQDCYFEAAKKSANWLLCESKLLCQVDNGRGLRDGIRENGSFDNTFWTYNQAVILKVLTELYQLTGEKWYFETALEIVDFVLANLVERRTGLLCEFAGKSIRANLSTDARSFKGIFMRYFAEFLSDNSELINPKERLNKYCAFVHSNAESVWVHCKNEELKTFSPYWHLKTSEIDQNDTPSLVAAMSLFTASWTLKLDGL